ncbi:Ig-like domain-containing protein [Aeromicrobium massiliense]|nr:Ig-like domain-containing protein [Aeromicrobium massiliense]
MTVRQPDGSVALTGSAQAWEVYQGADGAEYVRHRQTCQVDVAAETCAFRGLPTGTYVFDTGSWDSRDGTTRTFYDATSTGTPDPSKASRVQVTANDGVVRDLDVRRQRAAVAFVKMTNEAWKDGSWTGLATFPNPLRTEGQPAETTVSTFVDEGSSDFYALPPGLPLTFAFRPDSNQDYVHTYLGNARKKSAARVVALAAGDPTRLQITPQHRPTLRGTVQIAGGGDVTKLRVQGWMLRTEGWTRWMSGTEVAPGGSFVITDIPTGRWRLEVVDTTGVFRDRWYHNGTSLASTDDIYIDDQLPTPLDPIVLSGAAPQPRFGVTGLVASAPAATIVGRPVPVTVSMTDHSGGTVHVLDGERLVGTGRLVDGKGGAKGTVDVVGLGAGAHALRAYFAGTDALRSAFSAPMSVSVRHPATVSAKPAGSFTAGRSGALTVSVASAAAVPTGTVTVKDGTQVVGRAELRSTDRGTVRVPVSARPSGSRTLRVELAGSTNVAPAATTLQVTVAKASPTLSARVTRSLVVGSRGELAVTVTAPGLTPAGGVTVKDGSTIVGRGTLTGASRGTVRVPLAPRRAGTRAYTVVFAGSGHVGSRSVSARLGVAKARSKVALAPRGRITAKRKAKISVRVSAAGVVPTGRVTVRSGSKIVGVATLTARDRGLRVITIKGLPRGKRTLTVTYSGSAQINGATGRRVLAVR